MKQKNLDSSTDVSKLLLLQVRHAAHRRVAATICTAAAATCHVHAAKCPIPDATAAAAATVATLLHRGALQRVLRGPLGGPGRAALPVGRAARRLLLRNTLPSQHGIKLSGSGPQQLSSMDC